MSDYQPVKPDWTKSPLREWLGEPSRVYAVLRNSRRMDKAFYAFMQRGAKWRKPPLIHKGRKP